MSDLVLITLIITAGIVILGSVVIIAAVSLQRKNIERGQQIERDKGPEIGNPINNQNPPKFGQRKDGN